MADEYHYPGEELKLFAEAGNWKRYLSKHISPFIKGNVLEVGAGLGETTPYLMNDRVTAWTCLEPDEEQGNAILEKIVSRKLPTLTRVVQGNLDAVTDKRYDTILYIDVMEHIENDREEMQKAYNHLLPGGHLIVLSPAYPYLYSAFDKAIGHYRRYTKKSLRDVAPSRAGEVKLFYLETLGLALLWANKALARQSYPNRFTVRFWDRVLVPISRILDPLFFHSFGKTIIGIWQKT